MKNSKRNIALKEKAAKSSKPAISKYAKKSRVVYDYDNQFRGESAK